MVLRFSALYLGFVEQGVGALGGCACGCLRFRRAGSVPFWFAHSPQELCGCEWFPTAPLSRNAKPIIGSKP